MATDPNAPPRLPVPGAYHLAIKYSAKGQDMVNVVGARFQAPMTGLLASQWLQVWMDSFRTVINDWATITGAVVREAVPNGLAFELAPPTSPTGSRLAGSAVLAHTPVIKWSTGQGGRSGKGRTFLPGLGSTDLNSDGRTIQSAYSTAVTTAANNYVGNVFWKTADPNVKYPVVVSHRLGTAPAIVTGSCLGIVGVQRGRLRG